MQNTFPKDPAKLPEQPILEPEVLLTEMNYEIDYEDNEINNALPTTSADMKPAVPYTLHFYRMFIIPFRKKISIYI